MIGSSDLIRSPLPVSLSDGTAFVHNTAVPAGFFFRNCPLILSGGIGGADLPEYRPLLPVTHDPMQEGFLNIAVKDMHVHACVKGDNFPL